MYKAVIMRDGHSLDCGAVDRDACIAVSNHLSGLLQLDYFLSQAVSHKWHTIDVIYHVYCCLWQITYTNGKIRQFFSMNASVL